MSQPEFSTRLGHLSAAIFANESESGRSSMRSLSLSRRYFDRSAGEFRSSKISLNEADLAAVIVLLDRCQQQLLLDASAVTRPVDDPYVAADEQPVVQG